MNRQDFDEAIRRLYPHSGRINIVTSENDYSKTPHVLGLAKIKGMYDVYEVDERGVHESFGEYKSDEDAYEALYGIIERKLRYQNYIMQKKSLRSGWNPLSKANAAGRVTLAKLTTAARTLVEQIPQIFNMFDHKQTKREKEISFPTEANNVIPDLGSSTFSACTSAREGVALYLRVAGNTDMSEEESSEVTRAWCRAAQMACALVEMTKKVRYEYEKIYRMVIEAIIIESKTLGTENLSESIYLDEGVASILFDIGQKPWRRWRMVSDQNKEAEAAGAFLAAMALRELDNAGWSFRKLDTALSDLRKVLKTAYNLNEVTVAVSPLSEEESAARALKQLMAASRAIEELNNTASNLGRIVKEAIWRDIHLKDVKIAKALRDIDEAAFELEEETIAVKGLLVKIAETK